MRPYAIAACLIVAFLIYSTATYDHPKTVSHCPAPHQCECIDNSCAAMVVK